MAAAGGQFHNLGTSPFKSSLQAPQVECRHMSVFHRQHRTARTIRAEFFLGVWAITVSCKQRMWQGCGVEVGIKYLSRIEKQEGPTLVAQKAQTRILYWQTNKNEVDRHRLQPRHYPRVFIVPRTHETQKTTIDQRNSRNCY